LRIKSTSDIPVTLPLMGHMSWPPCTTYDWAFVMAAGVAASGVIGWTVMIRKVEALDWEPVRGLM